MPEVSETSESKPPQRRPLPIMLAPGMPVIEVPDGLPATIVGITQAYCLYRIQGRGTLAVAPWSDIALGNIRPADALLPAEVQQADRANAEATALRELLALKPFGLSLAQQASVNELVAALSQVRPPARPTADD